MSAAYDAERCKGESFFQLLCPAAFKDSFLAYCLNEGRGEHVDETVTSEYPKPNALEDPNWNVQLVHRLWSRAVYDKKGDFVVLKVSLECGFVYTDEAASKSGSVMCQNMVGLSTKMTEFQEDIFRQTKQGENFLAAFEGNSTVILVCKENVCFITSDLVEDHTEQQQQRISFAVDFVSIPRNHAVKSCKKYIGWSIDNWDTFSIMKSLVALDEAKHYCSDIRYEHLLAFCMGIHARAGKGSLVALLPIEIVREIVMPWVPTQYLCGYALKKFIKKV